MYKFKVTEPFSCTKEKAYEVTSRDFEGLEKYIPNVTLIKTEAHETLEDGRERWMLKFHGDGAIPALARAIVKPDMLRWKEEMICNPADMTIEWSVITQYYTEYFHCSGITYYREKGPVSVVEIDGKLWVDPMKIPGIPDSLVRKAILLLEPFVGKLIAPNLGKFYKAIKKRENIR